MGAEAHRKEAAWSIRRGRVSPRQPAPACLPAAQWGPSRKWPWWRSELCSSTSRMRVSDSSTDGSAPHDSRPASRSWRQPCRQARGGLDRSCSACRCAQPQAGWTPRAGCSGAAGPSGGRAQSARRGAAAPPPTSTHSIMAPSANATSSSSSPRLSDSGAHLRGTIEWRGVAGPSGQSTRQDPAASLPAHVARRCSPCACPHTRACAPPPLPAGAPPQPRPPPPPPAGSRALPVCHRRHQVHAQQQVEAVGHPLHGGAVPAPRVPVHTRLVDGAHALRGVGVLQLHRGGGGMDGRTGDGAGSSRRGGPSEGKAGARRGAERRHAGTQTSVAAAVAAERQAGGQLVCRRRRRGPHRQQVALVVELGGRHGLPAHHQPLAQHPHQLRMPGSNILHTTKRGVGWGGGQHLAKGGPG
jgi:hypothetical protein